MLSRCSCRVYHQSANELGVTAFGEMAQPSCIHTARLIRALATGSVRFFSSALADGHSPSTLFFLKHRTALILHFQRRNEEEEGRGGRVVADLGCARQSPIR